MLTPEYYEHCADDILNLYAQLEDDIISDVIRRIMKTGNVTETAKHQLIQLQEAGLLYDDILTRIAQRTDATEQHVKALFESAGVQTVSIDNQVYRAVGLVPVDLRQSPAMMQTLEAGYRKTLGDMKNLTLTTANTSQNLYYDACNRAYMQVVSGAFTYQQAIKQAIQQTAQDGAFVLYPSGHRDRVDVAVRRSVLTGIGQTCREIGRMNAEETGCDLMEISAHYGARPSHAEWQGQIVSLSGRRGYLSLDDIGYGTGDGFGGWNCRHDWFPYFEEYSTRNYTNSYLRSLEDKNIEYNGKKYSQYEISQIQRGIERDIRKAKREQVAFRTAVEESKDDELHKAMQDGLKMSNEKVKEKQAKMRDFIQQTNQDRDYFREQNYGRVVYPKNSGKSLTFSANNGKIKMQRAKDIKRRDIKPITNKRFDQLTIEARKNGAIIMRGGEEVEKHLDAMGADASILGDVIFFREEVCLSEVLEETHHFMQNINKMNDDKAEPLRTYLNEIEAKEFLLKNASKFNIPRSETEVTKKHLDYYKGLLDEYERTKL